MYVRVYFHTGLVQQWRYDVFDMLISCFNIFKFHPFFCFQDRREMHERSKYHRLLCAHVVRYVWLLGVVRLAGGTHCHGTMPGGCECVEQPFAINCIDKALTEMPDGLPDAPSMTISHNNINTLTSVPYHNLIKLLLDNNNIQLIRDNAFTNLTHLKKLVLAKNGFTRLGNATFAGLASLETLVLENNPLYRVTRVPFSGASLPALAELKMSHCSIYEIGDDAFAGLTQLRMLNISYNLITSLTSAIGAKTKLSALLTLDASHNRIASIADSNFAGLTRLDTLILSDNNIKTISSPAFAGLHGSMRLLDLSHNQLRDISSDAFKSLSVLEKISLQFNSLKTLDVNSIQWRNDTPIVLVHDNPWSCSCDVQWLTEKESVYKWNVNSTTK